MNGATHPISSTLDGLNVVIKVLSLSSRDLGKGSQVLDLTNEEKSTNLFARQHPLEASGNGLKANHALWAAHGAEWLSLAVLPAALGNLRQCDT
jgi:hypothetical protein